MSLFDEAVIPTENQPVILHPEVLVPANQSCVEIVPSPQKEEPELNRIESLSRFFYGLGLVTKETGTKLNDKGERTKPSLPLAERARRRDALKKIRELRQDRIPPDHVEIENNDGTTEIHEVSPNVDLNFEIRRELNASAERKEIAYLYIENQFDVTVDMPDMGKQTARMVRLSPSDKNDKPPLIFISTISGDPAPISDIGMNLATSRNDEVILLGYPESSLGAVTPEFSKAASEPHDTVEFGPHVDFFKHVVRELATKYGIEDLETGKKLIRLGGFSTGSAISAEILNDPEFQQMTTEAFLVGPAAVNEQTANKTALASVADFLKLASPDKLRKFRFIWGRKNPQPVEQSTLKDAVFKANLERVSHKSNYYTTAKVREGGIIQIVSGQNDFVTDSEKAKPFLEQNPQTKVITIPGASHSSLVLEPERMTDKLKELESAH